MTVQLLSFALIAALVLVRVRSALTRPEARLSWLASTAGAVPLTLYGFPPLAHAADQVIGGQNLTTLIRDSSVLLAVWCLRHALTGYARTAVPRTSPLRLAAVMAVLATLFLLIQHRTPSTPTLVLDQIAQPVAWLYGVTYMAAVCWMLLDAARFTLRHRPGHRWVRIIAIGAALTALGSAVEIAVFTAAHFRWGGSTAERVLPDAFTLPFFGGLITMLLGIAAITLLTPTRRRVLIGRLHLLAWRHRLLPATVDLLLAPLAADKHVAGRLHRSLVVLGNAQRAGRYNPTPREAALVAQGQHLIRTDQRFQPASLRTAA